MLQLLAFVASIVSMVSTIVLLVMAFKEDVLWGLASLCIPCAQLVFVVKFWPQTRNPFLVCVVSTAVSIGAQAALVGDAVRDELRRHEQELQQRAAARDAEEDDAPEVEAPGAAEEYRPRTAEVEAPPPPLDAATALARVQGGDQATRVQTLERWVDEGLHAAPGARLRMVKAVGPRADRPTDEALARAVPAAPLTTQEALDCVPPAPPVTRRALLRRLVERDPLMPSEDVARALMRLEDDAQAGIEETLVRIGHARTGCVQRLVEARGADWTRSEDGKALLDLVPVELKRELLASPSVEARLLGIKLVVTLGPDEALAALAPLLEDGSHIVRQEVLVELAALRDVRAVPALARRLLTEEDEGTRAQVKRALGALGGHETAQAFVAMLDDPDPQARLAAIAGIETTEGELGVRALARAVHDPERAVAVAAVKAMIALRGSRAAKLAVEQGAQDLKRVALETKDTELKRLARKLYYDITGRLPEQDRGR